MGNQSISSINRDHPIKADPTVDKFSNEENLKIKAYAYIYDCLTGNNSKSPSKPNVYGAVYDAMLNSIGNEEGLFKISARLIEDNVNIQKTLTQLQGDIHYIQPPTDKDKATMDELQRIETMNREKDQQKATLSGLVNALRQNASVATAGINADTNRLHRTTSEFADLIGVVSTIIEEETNNILKH